ncbi:hypothetical protein EDD22DRAFT_1051263 [Suillus occidentalis]|nr:hypothetical protein EDD22DRAFT_1051263 [Suillus occidentalis]
MPKAPKTTQSSVDDTKQYHCDCEKLCKSQLREVPYGTWRRHAEFRGPNTKGTRSLKEKRTYAGITISAAAQCASHGQSTSNTADIRRSLSLDRDPQPVQQDEQNYDSDIEDNHGVSGAAIHPPSSPFRYEIPRNSPNPDPQPYLDDGNVPAPLDADEHVLMEDIYIHVKREDLRHSLAFISQMQSASLDDEGTGLNAEAIMRLKFPLQLTPFGQGI